MKRQSATMQGSFRLSGSSSPSKTWTICGLEGCAKRAAAFCGLCKLHCHQSGRTNVCGVHGYVPQSPRPREPPTAGTSNTPTTEPSLINAPPDGIENHDEFSRHIDLDWGLHLINDAGYTAESQTGGANTVPPSSAPTMVDAVPAVVDRARHRDQEMADKERTIAVTVFAKVCCTMDVFV